MAETETVLLRRFARTRDAEAFAEITRRHAGLVYGAALRVLTDMDRAADVAQETFLQLTKDAASVTGSLPGWLHRVATHKAIDLVRRETSRRRREAEYAARQPGTPAEWKDISPYVDEGLSALDAGTRGVLIAHFLQGRTTRQIATVSGVSQATISRRVDGGVTQLRGMLRKRGIIVAAGVLSALLGENAVQAAPATLMTELGKMALVGGSATAATATAGASSGLQAVAGGVLTGVKAKVVAAAAVAAIGVGSVVTYQQATKPAPPAPTFGVTSPAARTAPRSSGPSVVTTTAARPAGGRSQAREQWNEMMRTARNSGETTDRAELPLPEPAAPEQTVAAADEEVQPPLVGGMGGGMGMGGFAMAADSPADPNEDVAVPAGGGMMGGGYYYARYSAPPDDPNDSNNGDPAEEE